MAQTADSTSSTEGESRPFPNRVAVGRIVGAHGLKGQLRVHHFAAGPDILVQAPMVFLSEREEGLEAVAYEVVNAAPGRHGEVRMALAGVTDRDSAEGLRGRVVLAEAQPLAELPEGEYYNFEFIGCRVESENGEALGTVREIWPTGAADILVVDGEGGQQHLIPASERLLREVDIEGRRIVIEVAPGLLDNASGESDEEA